MFSLLIDLDELGVIEEQLPMLAINRPGLLSFHEADHGDSVSPLREWAGRLLREHSIAWEGGGIEVLCYPRILGFVFNPLTVYFCRDVTGELRAILYEVHNTHGERHTYVLPADGSGRVVRHAAAKQFFVSPFMPMDCVYRFRVAPPGNRVGISIAEDDSEGLLLNASFAGRRVELTNDALRDVLLRYPLMTLKVVAGIHIEAARLLLKGMPVFGWKPAASPIAVGGNGLEGASLRRTLSARAK